MDVMPVNGMRNGSCGMALPMTAILLKALNIATRDEDLPMENSTEQNAIQSKTLKGLAGFLGILLIMFAIVVGLGTGFLCGT
jgi:hypothetical protein